MSPRIVVILPTRNRGTGVLTPIAAIRTGSRQDFEICVIDQSETTSETAAAIARLDGFGICRGPAWAWPGRSTKGSPRPTPR
jgi:glycosyltransferase involved in cell wall biosynthesis